MRSWSPDDLNHIPARYLFTRRDVVVRRSLSLAMIAAIAGAWELASIAYTATSSAGTPLVPGWEWLVMRGLPSLAAYAGGGFGSVVAPTGSYSGALAVLADHSLDTGPRVLAGLLGGVVAGISLGMAIAWSDWARRLFTVPAHILRTVPLLALIPLFQLWFGIAFAGFVVFVAYGVAVVMFAGTIAAVNNIPSIYIDNARVLGASKFRIYRSVVLPGVFPELRSSLLLSIGVSWGAVVGAEFVGAQTGLGYIAVSAQQFLLLDRIAVVALVFVFYAMVSLVIFERISRPLVRWMPKASE